MSEATGFYKLLGQIIRTLVPAERAILGLPPMTDYRSRRNSTDARGTGSCVPIATTMPETEAVPGASCCCGAFCARRF